MRKEKSDTNTLSDRINKRIIKKIIIVLTIFIFIVIFLLIFKKKNQSITTNFYEDGNASYNVTLIQNDFFTNDVLPANNQYISSIIDNINVNFKYNLKLEDALQKYSYKYRIETETKVTDKSTQNNIYNFEDTLKEEEKLPIENNKFAIDSSVQINYEKYNSMVEKLISAYSLDNIESKISITFYVDLLDENNNIKNTSKMMVNIPLYVKTANIEIQNDIDNTELKKIIVQKSDKNNLIFVIIAIILCIIEAVNINNLIKDLKKHCPPEIVENIKLKKILSEYGPYIQKVNGEFDIGEYNVMRVNNFEDMIRIREVTQNPILLIENESNIKSYFVITTLTSLIYIYEINPSNTKALASGQKEE